LDNFLSISIKQVFIEIGGLTKGSDRRNRRRCLWPDGEIRPGWKGPKGTQLRQVQQPASTGSATSFDRLNNQRQRYRSEANSRLRRSRPEQPEMAPKKIERQSVSPSDENQAYFIPACLVSFYVILLLHQNTGTNFAVRILYSY
jgi:hypothetical protein